MRIWVELFSSGDGGVRERALEGDGELRERTDGNSYHSSTVVQLETSCTTKAPSRAAESTSLRQASTLDQNLHSCSCSRYYMAKTVDNLRDEIRVSTGRFEREISAAFTKEDLAAICEAVGYETNDNSLPTKPQMRAGILYEIGVRDDDTPSDTGQPFRKGELESIVDALEK